MACSLISHLADVSVPVQLVLLNTSTTGLPVGMRYRWMAAPNNGNNLKTMFCIFYYEQFHCVREVIDNVIPYAPKYTLN